LKITGAQKKIIEMNNKSLLISASAGSGKTFVVVERVLSQILKNKADVDRLLLVTFTNAAASEMRERLLSKLYSCLDEYEKLDSKTATHILKQIRKMPQAEISTIHSFCLNIIRDNFSYLGIDPVVRLQDDIKSNIMIFESIEAAIEKKYEENETGFLQLNELFKSDENVVEILFDLYKYYQSMPRPKIWLEEAVQVYNIDEKKVKDLGELEFGQIITKYVLEKIEFLILEIDKICLKIFGNNDFKSRIDIFQCLKTRLEEVAASKSYNEIFLGLNEILPLEKLKAGPKRN